MSVHQITQVMKQGTSFPGPRYGVLILWGRIIPGNALSGKRWTEVDIAYLHPPHFFERARIRVEIGNQAETAFAALVDAHTPARRVMLELLPHCFRGKGCVAVIHDGPLLLIEFGWVLKRDAGMWVVHGALLR